MPKDKSNAPSKPAAAAASSALATQPETLPRAEVMAQKGYTSEQLFKLALSGSGGEHRPSNSLSVVSLPMPPPIFLILVLCLSLFERACPHDLANGQAVRD
jgi:hypothetical protein